VLVRSYNYIFSGVSFANSQYKLFEMAPINWFYLQRMVLLQPVLLLVAYALRRSMKPKPPTFAVAVAPSSDYYSKLPGMRKTSSK